MRKGIMGLNVTRIFGPWFPARALRYVEYEKRYEHELDG